MSLIRRAGRALVLVSFAAAAVGCCVYPVGGRGSRGHGGYQYGPSAGDRGYGQQPAPSAPPRQGRW